MEKDPSLPRQTNPNLQGWEQQGVNPQQSQQRIADDPNMLPKKTRQQQRLHERDDTNI